MRQNLHLYIGDMEVEFNQPPDILYTYQTTELTNPTVIKNSFSKQITIYGSPQNNNIFGQYWNVERLQGTSNGIGAYFNPSKKVPFTLYINGDIYESGYVKLDEVKIVEGKSVEYNITLYGGLGQFFYNLSTDWNTGNKRSLADLNYYKWSESTEPLDLSFTINKETVASAWTGINGNDIQSVINFAPVYAGIPDKIDADKVVMNFNNLSGFSSSVTIDNKTYSTSNGYALATLPQKLMAEEVRDYRSYLQTPIIRVKNVIEAICRKENNSGLYDNGYEVELDRDFFNTSNPYYYDSWMTLPSLTNLEFSTGGGIPTAWTGTWTSAVTNNNYTYTFPLAEPITEQNTTVTMSFDLAVVVPVMDGTGTVVSDLYMYYTRLKGRGTRVYYRNAYGIQLYASNSLTSNENVLAGTNVKWLTGEQKYDYNDAVASGQYSPKYNSGQVDVLVGNFVNCPNSIQYIFNKRLTFTCDLPVGSTCFKLQLAFTNSSNNSDRFKLSTSTQANTGTLRDIYSVMPFKTVPSDDKAITIQKIDNGSSYSNRYISKQMLLGTDFSPCDFLLSYCKQFGLYIYKDRVEDKIYIKTRKNFYHRDNIIDIQDKVDRLKDITVKPLNIDYGFFALTNSGVSSSFYDDYVNKYGKVYGQKIIATGYDFNADTKNLIDSVFKGAVQAKEMSQYFYTPNSKVHPYMYNSVKYALYEDGDYESGSTDVNAPFKVITEEFEPYDGEFAGYDYVSKPMFYDASRKPLGTEYTMLFFNGYESIPASYNWNLTDDIGVMYKLNNNPCWLMTTTSADTNGNVIALPITQFPRFSRWYEGNKWMIYSWDFGSPRELYVPNMTNNDEGNIYWNYFKTYYEDSYDVNSKVVEAYVINKDFTQEDLRNFYWFDNSIWRLNKIEDYNVTSFEGTKCEFVKVQDVNNYTNEEATTELWIKVTLDKYVLPISGGTLIGTVRTSDNFGWQIEGIGISPTGDSAYTVDISPESWGSSGNFFITAGTNSGYDKTITINVTAGDIGGSVQFIQSGVLGGISVSPTALTFAASGESLTLSVTNPSSNEWEAVGRPNWVVAYPLSGSATASTITLTASRNEGDERTGSFVIWNKTKDETIIIPVTQKFGLNSLSFENLNWVTDIAGSGGTATKNNCSYSVYAYNSLGNYIDVTSSATVTGSLYVPYSGIETRHSAGTLTLTAEYEGVTCTGSVVVYQDEVYKDYLKFTFVSGGTWTYYNGEGFNIEYSINDGSWQTSEVGAEHTTTVSVSSGDTIRVRGTNATYNPNGLGGNEETKGRFGGTSYYNLSGNIVALCGGVNYESVTALTGVQAFAEIFKNSNIISAGNLIIPSSVTMTGECYAGLFRGCTSLTIVPTLPSSNLGDACYEAMFDGCTSLASVPANYLPATTLTTYCYASMFKGCTSLTQAPELPATTLEYACYYYMFYGCTNLNYIKCLATDISAYACTDYWVSNVASTGTFVKNNTMKDWSIGVNGIPTNWTVQNESGQTETLSIENLTQLNKVSASGGTVTSADCSFNVYYDNGLEVSDVKYMATITGYLTVPSTTLKTEHIAGTLVLTATYSGLTATASTPIIQNSVLASQYLTFDITSAGRIYWRYKSGNRPRYSKDNGATWNMLSSYINVSENEKVLVKADTGGAFGTFSGSTAGFKLSGNIMSLVSGSSFENLDTITATGMCMNMFNSCTGLTDASDLLLPATTLSKRCYAYMFYNCASLTTAPKLPATTLTEYCYQNMFSNCSSLTSAPELPATTLANGCYQFMFQGCTSLTQAPELPATTLVQFCYQYMFIDCSNLNYIKCLATTNMGMLNTTDYWVNGVAATGTFVKNPAATWETGASGIPEGWVVQDASTGDTGNVQLNLSGGTIMLGTDCSANFNSPSTAFTVNGLGICGFNGDVNIGIVGESTYMFSTVEQDDLSAVTITYDWSHDSITYLNAATLVLNFDDGTTQKIAYISYTNGVSSTVVDLRDYFTPDATKNVNLTINASIV